MATVFNEKERLDRERERERDGGIITRSKYYFGGGGGFDKIKRKRLSRVIGAWIDRRGVTRGIIRKLLGIERLEPTPRLPYDL